MYFFCLLKPDGAACMNGAGQSGVGGILMLMWAFWNSALQSWF